MHVGIGRQILSSERVIRSLRLDGDDRRLWEAIGEVDRREADVRAAVDDGSRRPRQIDRAVPLAENLPEAVQVGTVSTKVDGVRKPWHTQREGHPRPASTRERKA